MHRSRVILLSILASLALLGACRREPTVPPVNNDPAAGVVFDPAQVPYPVLSAYAFFTGPQASLQPNSGVLPYTVIDALFSDYAKKLRHVWMPPGVRATWEGEADVLGFGDGTVLLKTFYYDDVLPANSRRIVETRLMYRLEGEWHFANYVWNAQQTEAFLDMAGSVTAIDWVDEGGITRHVDYRIPAEPECRACHKAHGEFIPIGPKPRNLATTYPYADGEAQQLPRWVQAGYLDPAHPAVTSPLPEWDDPAVDLTDRVRAYLEINCAHCHSASGYCNFRPMRFAWEETTEPENLGICVTPHDPIEPWLSHIISRGRPDRSMVSHRMTSTAVEVRMPILGRTLQHEEGVALIDAWIDSLEPICP